MGKMVEVKQFSNNKLPIPDEQFNRHWHTKKKKKKKPSKNTSKHQMRKPLVQYMYVTLVIINTVGQCLMILKPKGGWGGGVHNGVESQESLIWHIHHMAGWLVWGRDVKSAATKKMHRLFWLIFAWRYRTCWGAVTHTVSGNIKGNHKEFYTFKKIKSYHRQLRS